jgi:hypothetical protein
VDIPARHGAGDRVGVLLGRRWHAAAVEAVGRWSHHSGNSYPVYTVRFPDGVTLRCGGNSVRPRAGAAGRGMKGGGVRPCD